MWPASAGLKYVCWVCMMVFRLGDHDIIDQGPRHLDIFGVQCICHGQVVGLGNDDAAAVFGRHGQRQCFHDDRFVIHRQVAVFIGHCAANEGDIDRKRLV